MSGSIDNISYIKTNLLGLIIFLGHVVINVHCTHYSLKNYLMYF